MKTCTAVACLALFLIGCRSTVIPNELLGDWCGQYDSKDLVLRPDMTGAIRTGKDWCSFVWTFDPHLGLVTIGDFDKAGSKFGEEASFEPMRYQFDPIGLTLTRWRTRSLLPDEIPELPMKKRAAFKH